MKRVCAGDGCDVEIEPGLLMCRECRNREAEIAETQDANVRALEKSLVAHAAFTEWLRNRGL